MEERGRPSEPIDYAPPMSAVSEEVKEGGGPDELDRAVNEL